LNWIDLSSLHQLGFFCSQVIGFKQQLIDFCFVLGDLIIQRFKVAA